MTFPGWIPRWILWLFGLAFCAKYEPVIRCCLCGSIIDIPENADTTQCEVAFNRHYRESHGDQAA